MATRLDVVQPQDIVAAKVGEQGSAISKKYTIFLFHLLQIDLYRMTVDDGGDKKIEDLLMKRQYKNVVLQIRQKDPNAFGITYGDAIYGIQNIMHTMLYPKKPTDGFWENTWGVLRKTLPRQSSVVGLIELQKDLRSATNFSSSTTSTFNSSISSSKPLLAPFPVPGTDVTLLVGARGTDLPIEAIIWPLNYFFSAAWQQVASDHAPTPMGLMRLKDQTKRVELLMRPRKRGELSLISTSDLVEATTGIAYYMLQEGFFATKITVVRPDETGRRRPVADIEIKDMLAGTVPLGSGKENNSAIEDS